METTFDPERPDRERFDPEKHIRHLGAEPVIGLLDPRGRVLPGISGTAGVAERIAAGAEIGIDRIMMKPGSAFALHTHPGAHILYVLRARGIIHVDGTDYAMAEGDTVYVPAHYAHGVRTLGDSRTPLEFLAFGVPHMPLDSSRRMSFVEP
ncbi:cupin domain-containing protein [Streptomyces sp. UNOC14_S4]|uniref:cupin domain-containing protein n=1 Tax=Streptomyces sp. UNOC14_S4 TaxID=2872340 RepID=UPI001E59E4E3|nr:cupin domain-containing protein [Streptomyces sp. UNOC14_S4]MCC3769584.1 cupin domain-containing protein [Streptomyces sp. UNOC14_S4]